MSFYFPLHFERTNTKRLSLAVLLLLVIVSASGSLQAATVNVTATGTFSDFSDPGGVLPFTMPSPGTVFTLTFSYDDQRVDLIPGDPSTGVYVNTVTSSVLAFGSESFSSAGPDTIFVHNDVLSSTGPNYGDLWQTWSTASTTATTEDTFGLILVNTDTGPPVTPLTSDALIPPFMSAEWLSAKIRYRVVETPAVGDPVLVAYAEATLDSIAVSTVPVPPALWLFGSALGLLGWRRRKVT